MNNAIEALASIHQKSRRNGISNNRGRPSQRESAICGDGNYLAAIRLPAVMNKNWEQWRNLFRLNGE